MRKIIVSTIVLTLFSFSHLIAEDTLGNVDSFNHDEFVSRRGNFLKYVDVNLGKLQSDVSAAWYKLQVRTYIEDNHDSYYYVLGGKVFIPESDILALLQAIDKLNQDFLTDSQYRPNYLENKYETKDGFIIGYYIKGKNIHWFISRPSGSPSKHLDLLSFKNSDRIKDALKKGINTIEQIKKCDNVLDYFPVDNNKFSDYLDDDIY